MKSTSKAKRASGYVRGRPTKYDPKYCEEIVEFSKKMNGTFTAFACHLGVAVDTLNEWARVHKDFSVAKKIAKQNQEKVWFELGTKGVQNKIPFFGHSTYIFMSKAKFGWNEQGPDEQEDDTDLEFDLS